MPLVELRGIDKWFGGTHALQGVSLSLEVGEVHALVGENGAGKSTLVKILAGIHPAGTYKGDVLVGGIRRAFRDVREAEQAGITLVPQELHVVPRMSVAENLFLGAIPGRHGVVDHATLWRRARRWLDAFGLDRDPSTPIQQLSTAERQLVSIARAIAHDARVLILDEPTASLSDSESERLFAKILELRRAGTSVVYISHRLSELSGIADRATVLRDGRVVDVVQFQDREPGVLKRIVHAMTGREITDMYPKSTAPIGEPILEVENLTVDSMTDRPPHVKGVSFCVRRGEIVGIFGPVGAGQSELVKALFGVWNGPVRGVVRVRGQVVRRHSARTSMRAGMAYVPGDRKGLALFPTASVAANISVCALGGLGVGGLGVVGVLDPRKELSLVHRSVEDLDIRLASVDQVVSELSGGNQQKVVAARWLAVHPDVLILEEPTAGIDVGAKVEIYQLIGRLVRQGKGVLLVSSELQEVTALSDRIIAMSRGEIVGTWAREEANETDILTASMAAA
jgi:ABC-type sugar transport system ATPase subunit